MNSMINVLIIGAGEAGVKVLHEILNNPGLKSKYNVVGLVDDTVKKIDKYKILSNIDNCREVVLKKDVHEVVIAIPSARKDVIDRILTALENIMVKIKIVPCVFDIIVGDFNINQVRDFDAIDLLGREEIGFTEIELINQYKDEIIIVTGGGGSIGREIVTQLLHLPVKKVIALGHGENSIYDLIGLYGHESKFDYIIGDIRDLENLKYEFNRIKPDRVFHAAAHKHVPLMEKFPGEAVKNNVIGTYNCAIAAAIAGVKRFNLISTDKAVNPTSVMGTTKRVGERIVHSLNRYYPRCKFSYTRFGNVLGSRGSVVPLFKNQISKGGPVTVTHPEITRYFMSIPEAARLVLKAGVLDLGDLFILEMGDPIKISDLASRMISLSGNKDIPIIFTGLRPGEKLYEELLTKGEEVVETGYDRLLVSRVSEESLSIEQINELIGDLTTACGSFNSDIIKNSLKKWVLEYNEVLCQ